MNFKQYYLRESLNISEETINWISGWVDPVGDDIHKIRRGYPSKNIIKELSMFNLIKPVKLFRAGDFVNPLSSFSYDKDAVVGFVNDKVQIKEKVITPDMVLVDFTKIPYNISELIEKETEMFLDAKNELKEVIVFTDKIK